MQTYSDAPKVFISGKTLALWTVIMLGVEALAKLANIGVTTAQLVLASNYPETAAAAPGPGGAEAPEAPGGHFQMILLLLDNTVSNFGLFIFISTLIMFLLWLHRAYINLPSLGVPYPDFSSGWVIGSWFVPLLNLFRPYQIVKYIWNKSDPETVGVGGGYYDTGGNFRLKAWWGFWIACNISIQIYGSNISIQIYGSAENPDSHVAAGLAGIFSSGLTIVAACLAIAVVRDITSRQEERRNRLMYALQQQFSSTGASPNSY
jgi:Domain of unknown function (DUF4328)